ELRHRTATREDVERLARRVLRAQRAPGQRDQGLGALVAEVRPAGLAEAAATAHAHEGGQHMVPRGEPADAFTDFGDDPGALVAEDQGQWKGDRAIRGRKVAVADAAGLHLDQDFTGLGLVDADGRGDDRRVQFATDDGFGLGADGNSSPVRQFVGQSDSAAMKRSESPLLQKRRPVGAGPSLKMWPWWPPQRRQWYSVRGTISLWSTLEATAPSIGA